jgi:hypothetical protein
MPFLDFLRRKPASISISSEHPVFGLITLEKGRHGPYWMHDAYRDDELSISIDTLDEVPPVEEQVEFYGRITHDSDRAFELAAPLVVSRYEHFFRHPFPEQWRSALRLCGVGVPLHGDETNPWDISFECLTDNTGHIFTCYFVNGCPSHVSLDT